MDDLSSILMNVGPDTDEGKFIFEQWTGLKEILIKKVAEFKRQLEK